MKLISIKVIIFLRLLCYFQYYDLVNFLPLFGRSCWFSGAVATGGAIWSSAAVAGGAPCQAVLYVRRNRRSSRTHRRSWGAGCKGRLKNNKHDFFCLFVFLHDIFRKTQCNCDLFMMQTSLWVFLNFSISLTGYIVAIYSAITALSQSKNVPQFFLDLFLRVMRDGPLELNELSARLWFVYTKHQSLIWDINIKALIICDQLRLQPIFEAIPFVYQEILAI